MQMAILQRIRQRIIDREYYLSSPAEDEMIDDELERKDVENAILKGRIQMKLTEDIQRHKIPRRRSSSGRQNDSSSM